MRERKEGRDERAWELSTRSTCFREGTASDWMLRPSKSGTSCLSKSRFDPGGFRGRLVSAPMIKCEDSRCESAAMTCWALKPGFSGTFQCPSVASFDSIYS